jgi:5-keto 4-deoxyuronate isomerase
MAARKLFVAVMVACFALEAAAALPVIVAAAAAAAPRPRPRVQPASAPAAAAPSKPALEVRHAVHPEAIPGMATADLRRHFLVDKVFVPGEVALTYTHEDRMIIGGATPAAGKPLSLPAAKDVAKAIGQPTFLAARELAAFNIGGPGRLTVDGAPFDLSALEALYVPSGTSDVKFESLDASRPAKFYLMSCPAHQRHEAAKITARNATKAVTAGSQEASNARTLYHLIVRPLWGGRGDGWRRGYGVVACRECARLDGPGGSGQAADSGASPRPGSAPPPSRPCPPCSRPSRPASQVPGGINSAQLTFGVTLLNNGSVWNTMPAHLHDRRSEVRGRAPGRGALVDRAPAGSGRAPQHRLPARPRPRCRRGARASPYPPPTPPNPPTPRPPGLHVLQPRPRGPHHPPPGRALGDAPPGGLQRAGRH